MYSFYGGRPGNSFVIVKAFSSIEEMITNFAQGPNYTEVHYDEHVLINTENKNNQHNGEIYRRGYDYANAMGGAVYIGTIVGPAGKAPMLSLTTQEDIEDMKTQDGQDYTHMYNSGSFSIDQGLVPGKEENSTFNDEITWASYCIKDENSSNSTAYIGFTIPYTVFDWSVESVESYEPIQIIRTKKIDTSDEVDHPFYENLTLKIPKGVKGNSFTNLRIGDGSAVDGGASYEGALICDQYDYSTNPATKTIKNLGDPNMISNIEMNEDNEIIVTWKLAGSKVTNLGAINQIKQITVDDNNNLLVIYSDSSKMGDPSQLIHYNGKDWKRAGSIKTISGTKVFYQDEDPQNDERKSYDLNFHKMSDGSRELQIYLEEDGDWNNIKLSSTSIKSVKPNQIESEILNRLDDRAIDATTEIINYGKIKLDQNGTIYTEKIIEGTDGTQTTEEQVKISSNEGLFAKKGEIGGWTIEENKLSTSFVESSQQATIEIKSQEGFQLESKLSLNRTEITPSLISHKQTITNGKYSKLDYNGLQLGRINDIEDNALTKNLSYLHNNELKIEDITHGKSVTLTPDDLIFSDSSKTDKFATSSLLKWQVALPTTDLTRTMNGVVESIGVQVTVYFCRNVFWAHLESYYINSNGDKVYGGTTGDLSAGYGQGGAYHSITGNAAQETSYCAPPNEIIKYMWTVADEGGQNLIYRIKVLRNGYIGVDRILNHQGFVQNNLTTKTGMPIESCDIFWAHIDS